SRTGQWRNRAPAAVTHVTSLFAGRMVWLSRWRHCLASNPRVMYTLVRRFIKTGITFLGLGIALGLFMLVQRELWGIWPHPYLVSAHTHAVLVGFVMFLILGVGLWLFPRPEK